MVRNRILHFRDYPMNAFRRINYDLVSFINVFFCGYFFMFVTEMPFSYQMYIKN